MARIKIGSPAACVAVLTLAGLIMWWSLGQPAGKSTASAAIPTVRPTRTAPAPLPAPTWPVSLKNTDSREEGVVREDKKKLRDAAAASLREKFPGLRIDFDELTGSPKNITLVGKFLSEASADPVTSFVNTWSDLFGHDPAALVAGNSRVIRKDISAHNGMKTLVWQQELDGIPFFQTIFRANLTKNGELVTLGGNYLSDPSAATRLDAEKRAALIGNPPVEATRAIVLAAADIDAGVDEKSVVITDGPQGVERKREFQAPAISDTRAGLSWVPTGPDSARLAWDVTLTGIVRGEMFRILVDAQNGRILVRQALTNYIGNATYRVHADAADKQPRDSPTPMSPGHSVPLTDQPPEVAAELVTLDALDTTASPEGWIGDGVTQTLGNNVDAHADSDASPNIPDLPRPTSATRTFDFPADLAGPPSTYQDAAVTQLFYVTNWLHDKLYGLGFTESAGNFQTNNFSRGGLGNDAVLADAQDGSGTNNANFSTPPDGSPGRMQMYVFTGPTPDIDGDLDSEIVIHEYVHGLSNRLVGGGVGISALQTQGMGEGWSDFYALALLSKASDDIHGNYAAAAYSMRQFSGLMQNYYFGIRRYPYSTDLSKNPLTFKDIDPVQAIPHTGVPRSPIVGSAANEFHNQGEVWCAALWDLRANLITKHGFAAGNPLALQLVTDGMKLSPANPDFLQARDAIVQADLVNNAAANRNELWDAFAKRGMGASASSPSANTTIGLIEAYDIPDDLGVMPLGIFAATGQVGGMISPSSRVFSLHNSGTSNLGWTAVKTQPWITLSPSAGTLVPGATANVTASFNASAAALAFGTHTDTVTFTNTASGSTINRAVNLTVEPLYDPVFLETFENGGFGGAWTITGTASHRTLVTGANEPHGGNYQMTMDSGADDIYSRNEATLTLDLEGRQHLVLNFWIKMFNDEADVPATDPFTGGADFDGVAVSNDGGTTWHEIRDLRSLTNSWQKISVDLDAAIAARGLSYTSGFKIRFNHYDNYPIATDGFALDDILVAEAVSNTLEIISPDSATEGEAPVTATLSVTPPPTADLTVTLACGAPDATVPATVILPAGNSTVNFTISPVDDNLLDGSKPATITATATAYPDAVKLFTVHDNETATLSLDLPESIIEGSSPPTGAISVSVPVDVAASVRLTSESPSLQLPPAVTIPAGATSAYFNIVPVNDNQINGSRTATVHAIVTNWTEGADTVTILDDEARVLTVNLPSMKEGDTGKTGTAVISGTLPGDLLVTLSSDDTSELIVPATITIPAGQTSAGFPLTLVDDTVADGNQPVALTATAPGFPDAIAHGNVLDNDAHHFSISAIDGPVLRNAAVGVTVTAKEINGATLTGYSQSVTFSVAGVPITPTSSGGFVNGILSLDLVFGGYATNAILTVIDGSGNQGTGNPFDIVYGPLDHFSWSIIPSPQAVDAPFQATLRALDTAGNPVESHTTPLPLSAIIPDTVEILTWNTYSDNSPAGEYIQTKQAISSHFTNFHETSTTTPDASALAELLVGKNVFLIVEQESGTSATLGALGTAWTAVLNQFVSSGGTVIACSNTNHEHLLLANSGLLDLTPVGSPTAATVTKTMETPLNAGIQTPFDGSYLHTYTTTNGTVDLQTAANAPVVISRSLGSGRVVMIGTDFYTLGTGMDRAIANAVALAVEASPVSLPVAPAITGNFINGEWTGSISVPFPTAALKLHATDGSRTADSNVFSVNTPQLPPDPPPGGLILTIPSQVNEGSGPAAGNVSLAVTSTSDLTVNIVSKSPAKISVPATVIIPAGGTTAAVPLTVHDDVFVDGTKNVVIAVSAAAYPEVQASTAVLDNDGGTLSLALPAVVQENSGNITGSVSLSVPALAPMIVTLTSAPPAVAQVPATVTLPRGATSAQFTIAIPDDGIVDGDRGANLTASLAGWIPATGEILVLDDENRNLVLSIPENFRETDSPKTGTVSLNGIAAADVVVSLASSDTTEMTVPGTVTIPAGQASTTFALVTGDDLLADGPQPFTLTAGAPTFIPAETGGIVRDNEAHHFTFAPFGSPLLKNGPVPAIVTARDAFGAVMKDYNSPITFSAAGSSGALPVSPATGGPFIGGIWSGSVQIDSPATDVVLTVSDGIGHEGSSNPFDLVNGSLDRFEWSTIPSPRSLDTPFTATVRATDSGGGTATAYNGIANLFVLAATQNPVTGTGDTTTPHAIDTYGHDSRCDMLYTAAELGGAAKITALSFDLTTVPGGGQTLNNWTIRLKHTGLANLGGVTNWDNTGWTTVYQSSPVIAATGRMTFNFTSPFDYNGTGNLLVGCSMDRTASNNISTHVLATSTAGVFSVHASSNSTNGDPLSWSASTPYPNASYQRPDVAFTTIKELPVRPGHSGAFANGIWTGEISVPVSGNALALLARAGPVSGSSNLFDVLPPPAMPGGGTTVVTENFESGSLNPAYWTSTGTGNFRTRVTSSYSPHAGTRHLAMDTSNAAARNEATLTLDLAGRTGAILTFWAAGYNDEPNGPPASPFTGGADFDGVAISADGTTWWEVQSLRSLPGFYSRYTVDLDAAAAARGITYGTAFKIRFNQYDDNPLTTDGIVIDDILVTADSVPGLDLSAPAQVTEGDGEAEASVMLDAPAVTDTVVSLVSGSPAKVSAPGSVTVPAGQTGAGFHLTFPDDSIADGNRVVTLTGTIVGKPPRVISIAVLDDEVLPLSINTPATVAEGGPAQTGTLSLGAAASGVITVHLHSSDTNELTVPAAVVFQAGQTTALFPITVINDTRLDGPREVIITANVPGWLDARSTVVVTDNETRDLSISLPSVYEGSLANGLVSITGTLPENLTIALASSAPSQFTVPAGVTIPAGQTSVTFSGTAVDDSATDGIQTVTITATAATFLSASTAASAYDNDVHHFTFSNITSPRKSGVPFAISVSARDIGDAVIAPFNGTALLTAAGNSGVMPVIPGSADFVSGHFTENVTIPVAGGGVTITAKDGGITGSSNAFEVQQSPAIAVTPAAISLSLNVGESTTRPLTLANTGGGTLDWSIAAGAPSLGQVNASATTVPLSTVLSNLNAGNGPIRAAIPNRHSFTEGVAGNSISDGGADMYDTGNILNTNLGAGIPYSDNTIVPNSWLGTGGQYFTRKYDGLWVFAADVSGIGYFEINGNLGADGSGAMDSAILTLTRNDTTYRGFVKRVYNAGDPSVNHLIIIEDNGVAGHLTTTDTNNDYHRLTGLTGVTRVYDILYAGTGGSYIDNTATLNIMTAFIDAVSVPDWLSPATTSGSIAAGGTQVVTLDIGTANLTAGNHSRTLAIHSNDPLQPEVSVPVTLTVTNNGRLAVTPSLPAASNGPRGGPFTPASHAFTLTNTGGQPLGWTAGEAVAWLYLSISSGTLAPGATTQVTATINSNSATLLPGPHAATLDFTNTTYGLGNTTRQIDLSISPAGEMTVSPAGNFETSGMAGGPFTPQDHVYVVSNPGDAAITWTIGNSVAWLTPSSSGGTLAPGSSEPVTVTLNAAALVPGHYAGPLVFTNTANGRGNTNRTTNLTVTPVAPVLVAEPAFTPGTSNTLTWNTVVAADIHEIQAATDAGFSTITASSSPLGSDHLFEGLVDGNFYHYRVRAIYQSSGGDIAGPWSIPVSSTQDARPPVLVRNTSLTSDSAIIIPQGSATDAGAGVASVTVNGKPATLNPGSGAWTAAPLLLLPGENMISVSSEDALFPPNTVAESWSVTYTGPATTDADGDKLPDSWETSHGLNPADNGNTDPQQGANGDPDGDFITNLLEYVLGLDPAAKNSSGLPTATVETNLADGKRYLTFHYRRLVGRGGIHYVVETAGNPGAWEDSGAATEEISSVATGDGITELCTVRVNPAIDIDLRKFVRLKVSLD